MEKKVDFFIVGAMRSGTSSLRDALRMNPFINVPAGEPKFFSREYGKGEDFYHSQFDWDSSYKLHGEKSPQYSVSPGVEERIKAYNPSARIVWTFRNPVKRAISHQAHSRFRTKEALTLEDAVNRHEELEREHSTMAYVYRSQYQKHLERWLSAFPAEQHFILILEELLQDPMSHLKRLHDFLEVPMHESVAFPHTFRPRVKEIAEKNPVSEEVQSKLTKLLSPTVEWMESYLGRSIPEWH